MQKALQKNVLLLLIIVCKMILIDREITVDPDAKLEEELVVRPTSEAIIWNTYKGWIQSYQRFTFINQSMGKCCSLGNANTFVFENCRVFMARRAYSTRNKTEAVTEAKQMQEVYADFAENFMAMPVVKGVKSESERFAGAIETYTIEALMQDGKALQAGTSHFLGQNFAKAFDVKFTSKEGKARICLGYFLGSFYPFDWWFNHDAFR